MTDEQQNLSDFSPPGTGALAPTLDAAPMPWAFIWVALVALAAIATSLASFARGSGPDGSFIPSLALLICILAAGFDTATGRIPNAITYSAILVGLLCNTVAGLAGHAGYTHLAQWIGAAGPGQALAGFGVCAGIGLLCLLTAGMGGGDLKLLTAMGALMGLARVTDILIWAMAVAVLHALLHLILAGRLDAALRAAATRALEIIYLKQPAPPAEPKKRMIPLAVPLLIGLILWRVLPSDQLLQWAGLRWGAL